MDNLAISTFQGPSVEDKDIFPISIGIDIPDSEDWTKFSLKEAVQRRRGAGFDQVFVITPEDKFKFTIFLNNWKSPVNQKTLNEIFNFDLSKKLTREQRLKEGMLHISEDVQLKTFVFCRIEDQIPMPRLFTLMSFFNDHFKRVDPGSIMSMYERMVNEYPEKLMHEYTFPSRGPDGNFHFHEIDYVPAKRYYSDDDDDAFSVPSVASSKSCASNDAPISRIANSVCDQLMPRLMSAIDDQEAKHLKVLSSLKDEIAQMHSDMVKVQQLNDHLSIDLSEMRVSEMCEGISKMKLSVKRDAMNYDNKQEQVASTCNAIVGKVAAIDQSVNGYVDCGRRKQSRQINVTGDSARMKKAVICLKKLELPKSVIGAAKSNVDAKKYDLH